MSDPKTKLLGLLENLDFSNKYYNYYNTNCRGHKAKENFSQETTRDILATIGLTFKYDTKEDFYRYEQSLGKGLVSLNVSIRASIEFILDVRIEGERIGGPFPCLARDVARLKDENFEFSPRYPKLDCVNEQELKSALEFGLGLFTDIAKAVGETDWANQ